MSIKPYIYPGSNLRSFDQMTDDYPGRARFAEQLYTYLLFARYVFVDASRQNYEAPNNFGLSNISGIENVLIKGSAYFTFGYKTESPNKDFVNALINVWFGYEDVGITFMVEFTGSEAKDGMFEKIRRKAWYEIVELYPSFIFFRGVEEDVVWLGKSSHLKFL